MGIKEFLQAAYRKRRIHEKTISKREEQIQRISIANTTTMEFGTKAELTDQVYKEKAWNSIYLKSRKYKQEHQYASPNVHITICKQMMKNNYIQLINNGQLSQRMIIDK